MNIKNILCPTDFSVHSNAAIEVAITLARAFGAKVHFVHSVLSSSEYTEGYPHVREQIDAERRLATERLDLVNPQGIEFERQVLSGVPWKEIVDYASQQSIDLIVMATHGRTGLTRFLMGSFAEEVLRHAPCPVLTLKTQIKQPDDKRVARSAS